MKTFETSISVSGMLDPSLAKVVGLSQKEMMRLQKSVTDFNKLAGKSQLAMAGILPPTTKVTAAIKKTNDEANALADTFKRIGEIAAGVSIGSMIEDGLQRAVDLGKELVSQGIEFAKHASEAAASFELLSAGMGNLLRSQPMADSMLERLQRMAFKSPFQLTDLGSTAKQLIARGIDPNEVVRRTRQIGDIAAGLGLGKEGMDRLTLSYGESISGQTLNTKEINQMTMEGVPVWQELEKFTGKTVAQLHKMIEKHEISSQIMNKIFADLTGPDGLFFHGMTNFANTFRGKMTTFEDMFGRAERDFGNIVNDWVGSLLQFVNDSPAWQSAHEYFIELNKMSHSVLTFISGLPSSAIMGKFQPYVDAMEKALGSVNNFIGSFFTEVNDPVSGIHWVLNATGDSAVQKTIDGITDMFATVAKFTTSSLVKDLASYSWSTLTFGLKEMFSNIEEIAVLYQDLFKDHDFGKFLEDFHKYEVQPINPPRTHPYVEQSGAVQAAQDKLNSLVTAGASDEAINKAKQDLLNAEKRQKNGSGRVYYEHPDTEGHSSQYGPAGNKLGYGYGVGVGYGLQQSTGATFGKWAKIKLPTGSTVIRQVNETSAQYNGIEFVTPSNDEKSYGEGKATIEKVYDKKPTEIHYSPVYHISGDSDHILRTMKDHHHVLAKHVADAMSEHRSRSAVV